jgi:hypothetical protein
MSDEPKDPENDPGDNWLDHLSKSDSGAAQFAANLLTTHLGTDSTKLAAVLLMTFRMAPEPMRDAIHEMCGVADRIADAQACCLPHTVSLVARGITNGLIVAEPTGKPS